MIRQVSALPSALTAAARLPDSSAPVDDDRGEGEGRDHTGQSQGSLGDDGIHPPLAELAVRVGGGHA